MAKVARGQTVQEVQRELPEGKITFEEFLKWCDEDTWAEWVDGEVQMISPATDRHQEVLDVLRELGWCNAWMIRSGR